MTLASWQFVWETETLSASATVRPNFSTPTEVTPPGGGGMRHVMLTQLHKLPVIV